MQWGERKKNIMMQCKQVSKIMKPRQKVQERPLSAQEKKQNEKKDKPAHRRKAAWK